MSSQSEANLEFLRFLADISHSGTGKILADRLGAWLGFSEYEMLERWRRSGSKQWAQYANNVLMILDQMQDRTQSLADTFNWYRNLPISGESDATADELVSSGRVGDAVRYLRRSVGQQSRAVTAKSDIHDRHVP